MIHITCNNCDNDFGVEDVVTGKGVVVVEFHCPYCQTLYEPRDRMQMVGMSGGVNIGGGSSVEVKGDIAGRDIRR